MSALRRSIFLPLILWRVVCCAEVFDPEVSKYSKEFDAELASYAKAFDADLAKHPALSPEECAKQSPECMHDQLEGANERLAPDNPSRVNGISSLAGEDQFYLAYAHQLRLKTDRDYPEIQAFRQPLLKSFQLCMVYTAELYHFTPVRHEHARVPARVEWILFQGAHTNFEYVEKSELLPQANYRPELIEQLGVAMGRALLNNPKGYPFETEIRPILKRSLASLAEAERHMNESQKLFFRRQLVLFMARYM